jgi:tetratricopeptide (TPR) repeat protein
MKAVKVMLPVKTVKRLFAAEGYLELGMPEHALEELAAIEDAAPIEASIEYLTGEAFRQQERYDDAVEALERAAQLIPEPYNKVVWESLSDCFRKNGDDELADVAAIIAREAGANLDDVEVAFDDDADDYDFDTEEIFELREDVELFDADDDIAPPWHDRWA